MERITIGSYSNPSIPRTLADTELQPLLPTRLFCFSLLSKPVGCVRPEAKLHPCHPQITFLFFILASSSVSSGLSVFSAGSWALLYMCGWGRVWIQRDWEGNSSLLGENFVNKVGFSGFQPAASFFRAQCSHGKGMWGSTGSREGVSGWFFSSQTVPCQTEGKLHTGTSKGVEKSSLEEPDLRLSLPEKEGEKGKI